jgi:hypothetical protein
MLLISLQLLNQALLDLLLTLVYAETPRHH